MHLPGPLRAAVGLVVTAVGEAKNLPDRAIELPMLAVSTALQASLRAQQRYARLAERGDAALNRRKVSDEPPPWATFDEPVAADDAAQASRMLEDLFGTDKPTLHGVEFDTGAATPPDEVPAEPPTPPSAARTPAAKKTPARTATKKTAAKKAASTGTNGKAVRKPRTGAPSRFDAVEDD